MKKNYQAKISLDGRRISLGTFSSKQKEKKACDSAKQIYFSNDITLDDALIMFEEKGEEGLNISFDILISILNYRDNRIFIKTPIYIRLNYISYFLTPKVELKFDVDELFYYSSHKILTRGNSLHSLYVNDFGIQERISERYGLHVFSVKDRDYKFLNGDETDFRSSNISIINRFVGVFKKYYEKNKFYYEVKIHINGEFIIGKFKDEIKAAIAYNKAADYANKKGLKKSFNQNYIEDISKDEYKKIYEDIKLPKSYMIYFNDSSFAYFISKEK